MSKRVEQFIPVTGIDLSIAKNPGRCIDNPNRLRLSVYYSTGGVNYMTYKNEARGYYLSATPERIEDLRLPRLYGCDGAVRILHPLPAAAGRLQLLCLRLCAGGGVTMGKQVPCTFVSVWDGGMEVDSPAMFDPDTGIVSDIQMAQLPESILNNLGILDRELVRVNGKEYEVRKNDDDTYSAIRTFEVFFSRNGYAEVQAASAEEARRIADEEMKYDDVSWDDDWHPTDVQLEE